MPKANRHSRSSKGIVIGEMGCYQQLSRRAFRSDVNSVSFRAARDSPARARGKVDILRNLPVLASRFARARKRQAAHLLVTPSCRSKVSGAWHDHRQCRAPFDPTTGEGLSMFLARTSSTFARAKDLWPGRVVLSGRSLDDTHSEEPLVLACVYTN